MSKKSKRPRSRGTKPPIKRKERPAPEHPDSSLTRERFFTPVPELRIGDFRLGVSVDRRHFILWVPGHEQPLVMDIDVATLIRSSLEGALPKEDKPLSSFAKMRADRDKWIHTYRQNAQKIEQLQRQYGKCFTTLKRLAEGETGLPIENDIRAIIGNYNKPVPDNTAAT